MKSAIKFVFVVLLFISSVHAGVAVVVSEKSSVKTMTKDQVADLYLGKSQNLGDVPAVIFDLPDGAVKDAFYMKGTGRNIAQIKATWAKLMFNGKGLPPKVANGPVDLKKAIAENPNAIGYLDSGDVDASVRVVLKLE